MAVVRDVAMVVAPPGAGAAPGGGRGAGRGGAGAAPPAAGGLSPLDSLRQLLRDADVYGRAHDAYAKDKSLPRPARDVVLDALVPVIRGKMPVFIPAGTVAAIRDAVTFAQSAGAKPILFGAAQALQSAAFLKEHNVGVIFTGTMTLPANDDDPYDLNYSTPAKLAAAGVKFALASGSGGAEVRNLPYVAGMAAAFGLSKDDALKAVTLWPAEIFGVADRLGSIEVGKIANLVITTGDLLEARTDTKALFIDGRPVPLGSKHTYLFELYKDRK
jgi:imidazolonepropionase-like amidohydrolase